MRTKRPPARAERKLLVLCPTCDEPFRPEFPARCEWCGHRFADGRESRRPRPSSTSPFEDMNPRVWIVIGGLVVLLVATLRVLRACFVREATSEANRASCLARDRRQRLARLPSGGSLR